MIQEVAKSQKAELAIEIPLKHYSLSIADKLSFISEWEWENCITNYLATALINAGLASAYRFNYPEKMKSSRSIGRCLDDLDDFDLLEGAIGREKANKFYELELSQKELFALVQFLLFEKLKAKKEVCFPEYLVSLQEAESAIVELGFDCEIDAYKKTVSISDGLTKCEGDYQAILAIAQKSTIKVLPDLDACIGDGEDLEASASNLLYEIDDLKRAVKDSSILTNVESKMYEQAIEQATNAFEALQGIGETRQLITIDEV